MSSPTTLLPFQPATMSTAQLAAVSFLARYSGRSHRLYQLQLREWFAWCGRNALDPLVGIQPCARRAVHPQPGRARPDGLIRGVDDERGPRLLPLRAHRRARPGRPGGVRPAAEGSARRVPHPRPGPARADPVPAGRPDPHRPPRRSRVPARHQRLTRLRGRSGADRGLRRHPARPPRPAPGREGQQARHDAGHGPRPTRAGDLPRLNAPAARSSCGR
jgi:hypothetical protein